MKAKSLALLVLTLCFPSDVGQGSQLILNNGAGTISNHGTVRLLAGASPAANANYAPISATIWNGVGIYQALGGTWDPAAMSSRPPPPRRAFRACR